MTKQIFLPTPRNMAILKKVCVDRLTLQEMSSELGLSSNSTVATIIRRAIADGFVQDPKGKFRNYKLTRKGEELLRLAHVL